jgi:maltooligosyltrehalose synthase
VWQDTRLLLPGEFSGRDWRNIFTGEYLARSEQDGQFYLAAAQVIAHFPVALLESRREA